MIQAIPHILFVDDEDSVLSLLKKLVAEENWHCHFAASGQEALALLEKQQVDLVLSDVMMPGMSGIELLGEVKLRYPSTIRIFLTAFANQGQVAQALAEGFTQQIIPKPWVAQELKEIIHSALRQSRQQKQQSPEFQATINSIPLLPPLPENYSQVKGCITADGVDIEKMAMLISQDVAISSALLHWANSALFGQRYQVDTVKKAIIVLGTDIVENLILSASINQSIANNLRKIPGFDPTQFQKHSMAVAVISRLLIKTLNRNSQDLHDRTFIAGLLHDLGKLAAACFFPDKFAEAIRQAEIEKCSMLAKETAIIGTSHTELGSFLAEWWALPPFIVNSIRWHHRPADSPIETEVINAVHLANLLSYQFNFGLTDNEGSLEIPQETLNRFYLNDEGVEILQAETWKTLQALAG